MLLPVLAALAAAVGIYEIAKHKSAPKPLGAGNSIPGNPIAPPGAISASMVARLTRIYTDACNADMRAGAPTPAQGVEAFANQAALISLSNSKSTIANNANALAAQYPTVAAKVMAFANTAKNA